MNNLLQRKKKIVNFFNNLKIQISVDWPIGIENATMNKINDSAKVNQTFYNKLKCTKQYYNCCSL